MFIVPLDDRRVLREENGVVLREDVSRATGRVLYVIYFANDPDARWTTRVLEIATAKFEAMLKGEKFNHEDLEYDPWEDDD